MKRILVTGNGKSGSWKIRGEQLGAAIGAKVESYYCAQPDAFDFVVGVKRGGFWDFRRACGGRIPFVWDIVDAWPQPTGNSWHTPECLAWLKAEISAKAPLAIVAATQAMEADIREVGFKGPVLTLPHHARPGQAINPIRRVVQTVGYEGGEAYLGKWKPMLGAECARRGWKFVVNPKQLADLDIVVALRDIPGYAPTRWKSNVKLANAQGSGTPFIGNREFGYLETASGAEEWADTKSELIAALDLLSDASVRYHASTTLREGTPLLENIATTYRNWLESL